MAETKQGHGPTEQFTSMEHLAVTPVPSALLAVGT